MGRRQFEHPLGVLVDENQPSLDIHHQNPFDHTSENRLYLFLLGYDLADLFLDAATHLVEIFFEETQLILPSRREQFLRRKAPGDSLRELCHSSDPAAQVP